MKEIVIKDKQNYLIKNYPFSEIPDLADRKKCIHCDSEIIVGNYKVFADDSGVEYISCPNTPKCNGTVIDWVDI